jgi:ATP-dependent DNA helicase RecG
MVRIADVVKLETGRPYLRQGSTTIVMPRDEYERRLVERLHATRRWENEPVPEGVTIEDLDAEEIQITLDNAIRLGRLEASDRRDTESILRGLEVIHDGRLLNAAAALYGKADRLKPLYPQLGIRLARFRGTNRLADFADNRQYWGHAFALLHRAESFLMDHVPIAGRVIPGKMVREDQPWYPPRATREAIANAICHRDYTIPGGAVAVAMYDDHLEITNPGDLHFGITPEKLTRPHESKPWNPIIANVFYRAGVIERWGTGTLNIIDWCGENGNPPPAWTEEAGSVYVTFKPAALAASQRETAQVDNERKINEIKTIEDFIGSLPALTAQITAQVTEQVLNFCREPRKSSEIMELLGLKHWKTFQQNYLLPLLESEIIERTIPEKPTSSKQKYRLGKKGSELLEKLK